MVRLCRSQTRSDPPIDLRSLDPTARRDILRAAGEHAVLGLCLAGFQRSGAFSRWPDDEVAELSRELSRLRRQAALWDLERDRILTLASRRGVHPVVLKGAALRTLVYREPVERAIGDLDLLVGPEAYEEALQVLTEAGYENRDPPEVRSALRLHHFHDRLRGPGGFAVELHWGLQPSRAPFALPVDDMLARSVESGNEDIQMRALCPEDTLLHIVSQSLEDGFAQVRRIVDLDRIVVRYADLDWDAVVGNAEEAGLTRMTALALDLSRALLGTSVPNAAMVRLRPPRKVQRHLRLLSTAPVSVAASRRGRSAPADALYLALIDRPKTRLRHTLRLFRGRLDPIRWVFEEERSAGPSIRMWGPLRAAKLVAFVVISYVTGATLRFTPAGRLRWRTCARALPYGALTTEEEVWPASDGKTSESAPSNAQMPNK